MKSPMVTRAASIARSDDKQRTVDVVWTTGARVARYSWARDEEFDEELVVEPSALRLERLNSGAPFLDTHRSYGLDSILGVVVEGSVRIEGGKGYATIRLSDREEVEPIWRDMQAGIIRNVSVGYKVHKYERTAKADRKDGGKRALYRAIEWEPMEISAVAIGADAGAQLREEANTGDGPVIIEKGRKMPDGTKTPSAGDEKQIRALFTRNGFESEAQAAIERGMSVEEAREHLQELQATRDAEFGPVSEPDLSGMQRGGASMAEAMQAALVHRHSQNTTLPQEAQRFAEMTVPELAVEWCRSMGINYRGGNAGAIDAAMQTRGAVGYQSTSDFPSILSGTLGLLVLDKYQVARSAVMQASRERTFDDFREVTGARISGSVEFDKVLESGEYKYGQVKDGGEKIKLATYGKILAVTRQTLINDSAGAFERLPQIIGTGAAETEGNLLAGMFAENSGAGPVLSDGNTVFHENNGNIGAAAAINTQSLSEAYVKLRRQRGLGGEVLAITPTFLIVAPEKETEALQAVADLYAASSEDVNVFARRLQVLVEPRFEDPLRWYLAAAPGRPESLVHGYLRGQRGPQITTRVGFEVDGMEIKGSMDFATGFMDWRGWIMNPGATAD
ncbi:prohead protease/major capsid protein fusion protein [Roseinatronobacter bogoriensis]|nr:MULTISPECIES: prohead protease/major capsid protein fusion protein [Rhodobaca]MBB4207886.1 hypothetical protein [Rhodobaca bogoriensis DSM 18756]TDY71038.1 Mu-like prophage major head subunit gpT [Rhodobaca bogoriensis DSM 18756]